MSSERKPSSYHHGNLPAALTEAALQILESRGLEALTVREVARRAGVTHAAPYRHFRDKAALLSAVAEAGYRALRDVIAATASANEGSANQILRTIGVAYLQFAQDHPAQYRVMFARSTGKKTDRAMEPFDALCERLTALAEPRTMQAFAPATMAHTLWSQWHGLTTLVLGGHIDAPQAISTIHATIDALLGADDPTPDPPSSKTSPPTSGQN